MRGGHNRKTLMEHIRDGTLRPARHAGHLEAAACSPTELPSPPDGMSAEARAVWDTLVPELVGVAGPRDALSLRLLSETAAELFRATRKLSELELGSTEHARLVRAVRGLSDVYERLAVRYGLDPISRERLPAPDADAGDGIARW